MSDVPTVVLPVRQSDRDRLADEDYEYGLQNERVYSSALLAWIRRCVDAERRVAVLEEDKLRIAREVGQALDGLHRRLVDASAPRMSLTESPVTMPICHQANCDHERLNEDGICRACGADCRGTH